MKKLLISFLLLIIISQINPTKINAQATPVSGINLLVSNVCESWGQIIGCNGTDSSGALPSIGEAGCVFQSSYTHKDSVQFSGKIKFMDVDAEPMNGNGQQFFYVANEDTIFTYYSSFPNMDCHASIAPGDTFAIDSIVDMFKYNNQLYIIRSTVQSPNFLILVPPSQTPVYSTTINIKPQKLSVISPNAVIIGEGINNEPRMIVFNLQFAVVAKDTALSALAANPIKVFFGTPNIFYLASSPGDTAITLTKHYISSQALSTIILNATSGINTCEFVLNGFLDYQPLTDASGSNNHKKIFRYDINTLQPEATFNLNMRLHKIFYIYQQFFGTQFIHTVEESAANNQVRIYNFFYNQVDSFTTTHQVDFMDSDFRCSTSLEEYDDDLVKIKAFPNPTNGMINIKASGLICGRDYEMDIVDIKGEILIRKTIQAKMNLEIPLDQYASGIYFLRIHTKKGIVSERIVKN